MLALEFAPGMKMDDLFAEDLIGTGGFVGEEETWRLTYAVPGGSTGGPWSLDVDKESGKIVGGSGGQ